MRKGAMGGGQFSVYCVCGGFGFPFGMASTKRIKLMGKCLIAGGIPFHVLHIGPSPFAENRVKKGACEGITFEYLSLTVGRPGARAARAICYLWGCLLLSLRLLAYRRDAVVYVYCQGDVIDLWTLLLCRLLGIPTAQEACEWWPGTENDSRFVSWCYSRIIFRWSSGALPISREIGRRIRALSAPEYPLCTVPVLVDPAEMGAAPSPPAGGGKSPPVFLWCGMVDGYKRDVTFLIDALAHLSSAAGASSLLRIAGPCSNVCRGELVAHAVSRGIETSRLDVVGFVSDAELWRYCAGADALLMPLWDDDRSRTRFPTKLGQYVAAGRPIVTAQVGEMVHLLAEDTALFYPPGDPAALARALERLLADPAFAGQLAARAAQDVLPKVDFNANVCSQ